MTKIMWNNVVLRPAEESDREKIYQWFAKSDVTASMIGPPDYPDHPIPSREEFFRDYNASFFNTSGNGKGRNFIIMVHSEEVGTVGYDLLDRRADRVVLDIWMRAEKYCGKGYGSDALQALCRHIHETYGITHFVISPSARNKRAVAAYQKAGFKYVKDMSREEQEKEFGVSECDDNILMIKTL